MKKAFGLIVMIIFIFVVVSWTMAYDTNVIHPIITEIAVTRSNLDGILKQQLGIQEGVDKILIENKTIKEWIMEGGKLEDETNCRSKFHFHDPTESFDSAGLSNIAIDTWCGNYNHRSSLVWAQDTADNLWSWQQARLYYLEALTDANKDIREEKFAATFRALGQVMHLVSDASVPAHVRNDIHIFPIEIPGLNIQIGRPTYESWAKANPSKLSYGGVQIGQSIFKEAVNNNIAPAPISALWDQNKYTGYNPADAVGTNIGIAEYTNANFFSEDTIFKNFTYPSRNSVTQVSYEINDPRNPSGKVLREYYQKIADGDTGYRLATVGFLKDYLFTFLPNQVITLSLFEKPALDGEVYGDYAARLVPRAVGYSAGLLDYFFRGKIEMVDDKDAGGYVIKNDSDEDMDGTFELYYDTKTDERKKIQSSDFPLSTAISAKGKSSKVTFTPPDDAKETCKYILVFQGKLGNEDGAVVAGVAEGGEVFCIATQTVFSATVPGYGQDNAACISGGEIIGVTPAGEVPARNSTLEIHHTGSGTFKINGVEITDHVWAYDTWYAQTGWPATWEIQYSVLGTGWTPPQPYEGVIPSVVVKQGGEADIILWPFVVNYTLYGEDILSPGTREYGWWAFVDHWCSGGKHFYETWWSLYRSGEEWTRRAFWLDYKDGGNFLSSNFPTGSNRYHSPYPYTFQGAILPEYGVENCKWGDSAGIWYSTPWGLDAMRTVGIWDAFSSTNKFFQHSIESYFFGTEEWENADGICPEDTGLTPTLCSMEYPYDSPPEGNPITISMFKCYWKITGSSLETLFLERGYPLIERQFNLQIEGVPKELL